MTQSFLQDAPFSNATLNNKDKLSRLEIPSVQELASSNALINLTAAECATQLYAAYQTEFETLLLVTDIDSTTNSLVQTASASSSTNYKSILIGDSPLDWTAVKFCLAQPSNTEQACDVNLNGSLLGVIVLLNLVTIIVTAGILFRRSFQPLVSLGDALSSFLQRPDLTTSGSCLMTKAEVRQGRWGLREARFWVPRHHSWFATPSIPRWCLTVFVWVAPAALAATAFALTVGADPSGLSSFGTASSHAVHILPSSTPIGGATLVAALPQFLLAVLYLVINSLMTTYYLSHESSLYALGRPLPLRVTSSPAGFQTTSLFLTLPRPWSWFLAALFAATAFVLSQSVFVVSVHLTPVTATPPPTPNTSLVALGLSGTGLVVLLALLLVPAITVICLGCRRAPPAVLADGRAVGNPLALDGGSCSAVLGARCHAVPRERDGRLWQRPLTWGSVDGGGLINVAHCTFTAGRAGDVDMGRSYA